MRLAQSASGTPCVGSAATESGRGLSADRRGADRQWLPRRRPRRWFQRCRQTFRPRLAPPRRNAALLPDPLLIVIGGDGQFDGRRSAALCVRRGDAGQHGSRFLQDVLQQRRCRRRAWGTRARGRRRHCKRAGRGRRSSAMASCSYSVQAKLGFTVRDFGRGWLLRPCVRIMARSGSPAGGSSLSR